MVDMQVAAHYDMKRVTGRENGFTNFCVERNGNITYILLSWPWVLEEVTPKAKELPIELKSHRKIATKSYINKS